MVQVARVPIRESIGPMISIIMKSRREWPGNGRKQLCQPLSKNL
jgi:hypothetical protein